MTDVLDRSTIEQSARAKTRLTVIDCDIHPAFKATEDLLPFLSKRWRDHLARYGAHVRTPYTSTTPYPRSAPLLSRRDAWPPNGGPPGSDLEFMRTQHLDPLDIEHGILQVLDKSVFSQVNHDFGAALQAAINDWQLAAWCDPEPRLKAAIHVGQDDAESAVAEIERCSKSGKYVQVNISPRANEPLGRKRYWPIYEAAVAAGLPLGIHVGGQGGHAPTPSGWPSTYNEEHHSNAHSMASQVASLVIEGVTSRFPKIKFVFVEGGFGWVPAQVWRLDKQWEQFRDEVPHLKRPPSEHVREHFWFTTQPIEEPERARDMRTLMDWIGWDRILFSSDYPHWDFDDPRTAFKIPMSEPERRAIMNGNAAKLYGFG